MMRFSEPSSGPTSGEQVDHDDHDCDHQQQMYQSSGDVEAESQQPHDQQYGNDGPKHGDSNLLSELFAFARFCRRGCYCCLCTLCVEGSACGDEPDLRLLSSLAAGAGFNAAGVNALLGHEIGLGVECAL